MGSTARWLYARSAWRREWLWDVGALLALLNGGVLADVVAGGVSGYVPLVAFVGGFGATFAVFLAADAFAARRLPVVVATGPYQILVSAAIVGPFFLAAASGAALLRPGSPVDEVVLVVVGNAAALTTAALVVARYSRNAADG